MKEKKTYHNKNRLKKIHDYLLALKGFLKESFQLKKISTFVVLKEIANHIRIEHKQIKNKKTHKKHCKYDSGISNIFQ